MTINYARVGGFDRKAAARAPVPQSKPIRGRESVMEKNAAGGYGFTLDDFGRVYRFLILGTEGGSYYVKEREFTRNSLDAVKRAIATDPRHVVDMAVEILRTGRAFKTDPALFVLALVASYKVEEKTNEEAGLVRKYALDQAMGVIVQTTQLFHFMKFVQEMRGWGSGLRKAFARWYVDMPEDKLALQVTKYKNRDGVTHRDMLRLAHPKWPSPDKATPKQLERALILNYAARPGTSWFSDPEYRTWTLAQKDALASVRMIAAAEELLHLTDTSKAGVSRAVGLITDHGLTHEMVAPELKNSADVWAALAETMPVEATLRNLGKLSQVGVLAPLGATTGKVISRLTDAALIQRSRAHPIRFLIALRQYQYGRGMKGSLTWDVNPQVVGALEAAFPLSFGNVPRSDRAKAIGIDMSGSMMMANMGTVVGLDGWLAGELAGAMAFIHLKTNPNSIFLGFATQAQIEKNMHSLTTVTQAIRHFAQSRGGTDTAAPLRYLYDNRIEADAIVTYTDNETWAGRTHVVDLYRKYVQRIGRPVKFFNAATSANATTDVDPTNPNMFELCGFDAAAPKLIADFVEGQF